MKIRVSTKYSIVFAAVFIASCSGGNDRGYYDDNADSDLGTEAEAETETEAAVFDEDAAREEAESEVSSETYSGIGAPFGCTDDCSGHEAGFDWRRDNGYVTAGNSQSFEEGAQAFEDEVNRRIEEMEDEHN